VQQERKSQVLRFGVFEANVQARELRKHGTRVPLRGQPFCILSILLEQPGEPVTREEMRQRLWPADTFVDFEHSLNSAMKKLRAALGDSPENSRYIETIPRVGYRFIAPVQSVESRGAPKFAAADDAAASQSARVYTESSAAAAWPAMRRWLWVFGTALMAAGTVAYGWLSAAPAPRVKGFVAGTVTDRVDGFAPLVTDGSRVYFLERVGDHDNLMQTSTAGGEARVVEAPFRNTRILDVSPDHQSFSLAVS
jgi:DNA-binding winged helix-turn-helix (wHTH) protein